MLHLLMFIKGYGPFSINFLHFIMAICLLTQYKNCVYFRYVNVQKYNHQFISTSYRCILSQSKSHNQRTLMYKCKRSTNFIYDFNESYANKSDSSLSKWHNKMNNLSLSIGMSTQNVDQRFHRMR